MMYRRSMAAAPVIIIVFLLVLAGCSTADRKPDEIELVNKEDIQKTAENGKTAPRTLYLVDAAGRLAPQTIDIPESDSPARQAIDYLVKDGPVSQLLPNGFQAPLPPETAIKSASLKNETLNLDFSKDLLSGPVEEQDRIIQSIVWTATQFDTVKRVNLQVEGKPLEEWPDSKRPIGSELTREDGINTTFGGTADISASEPVTAYYLSSNKGNAYYVPVTVRIAKGSEEDRLSRLVETMIHEPAGTELISAFNPDARLIERPTVKDGIVHLHFNNGLYSNDESKTISDQALESLVMTFTGIEGIRKVAVKVDRSDQLVLESGKKVSGPVSRSIIREIGL